MISLDHQTSRGCPYCPMMKEDCLDGWTKSMGEDSGGRRKRCVAWRSLPMVDLKTNQAKEVFACSVYEWPPALAFELSNNQVKGQASTDKVANNVAKGTATFLAALPPKAQGRVVLVQNGLAQNGLNGERPQLEQNPQ